MKTILLIIATLISTSSFANVNKSTSDQSNHKPVVEYPNTWESLKLKGLNLKRLQVPGGWLVREGLGKLAGLALDTQERKIVFVPDQDNNWQHLSSTEWQKIELKGLNVYRLETPGGWLVREGIGKIGSIDQTLGLLYLKDADHTWVIKKY